jgi:secreted trypsin-like serine protease
LLKNDLKCYSNKYWCLIDNYSECGVANTKSNSDTSRIVGGEETAPNEFPWQALIKVEMTNGENVLCGGSLIADQWILTAAHCIG